MADTTTSTYRNIAPWLLFGLAVAITHNWYAILSPFHSLTKGTRFGSYLELATPFAVVGSAAWAVFSVRVTRLTKLLFGAAAILYIEGHGIHLAANSINNQHPTGDAAATAHFWDEQFGHIYEYLGWWSLTLLVAFAGTTLMKPGVLRIVVALLYGFTLFTNGVEAGLVPLLFGFLAVAVGFSLFRLRGWRIDLLVASALAVVLLAIFGIWHGGFPQFSELGWV